MFREVLAHSAIILRRPLTFKQFVFLKKAQHWENSKLLSIKEKLLRNTLAYAYDHCPYYQKSLKGHEACWTGSAFDWEIFLKIPPLTKEAVRKDFRDLQSSKIDALNVRMNRSGGSTGQPTKHLQDDTFRQMDMANNMLFKDWAGVKVGNRSLFIAANENDFFGEPENIQKKITDIIFNKQYFNAFRLNTATFENIVTYLKDKKPEYLQMYASAAYELSKFIITRNLSVPSPKMLMCVAGTTYDEMLDVMEKAFRTKVYARYGSRETGDMAGMCINRIYHEIPFTHHIDILDENNQPVPAGETGHIAVTVLTNKAMPLIRYKIGDVGIWHEKECGCGTRFRALKKIVGRTGEIIKNSKGKIILPEIFIHLIGVTLGEVSDYIERFQVAQTDIRRIELRLVLRNGVDKKLLASELINLKKKIIKIMEEDIVVDTVYLNEIPRLPSGKFTYTVSCLEQSEV